MHGCVDTSSGMKKTKGKALLSLHLFSYLYGEKVLRNGQKGQPFAKGAGSPSSPHPPETTSSWPKLGLPPYDCIHFGHSFFYFFVDWKWRNGIQ